MFLKKLFVLFLAMCLLPVLAISTNAVIGDACDATAGPYCDSGLCCSTTSGPGTCQTCSNSDPCPSDSCPGTCCTGSSQPCGNLGGACCQTGYTSTGTPVSGASDCPGYCYSGGSCTANTADPCPSDACPNVCCQTGSDPCPSDSCPNVCCSTTACNNWASIGQGCNPSTGTCCSSGTCSNTAGPGTCTDNGDPCPLDSCPNVCCTTGTDPCPSDACSGTCCTTGGDPCPSDACPNVCCGTTGTCANSPANCFTQTECTGTGRIWCNGMNAWPPCFPAPYICSTTTMPAQCQSTFDGCCKVGAESYDPDCSSTTSFCGNGRCEANEDKMKCPMDCGFSTGYCGDGFCNGAETTTSCHDDCGTGAQIGCPTDPMFVRDRMKCNECGYMWCDNMYFDSASSFGSPCFPRGHMCPPSSMMGGVSCAPGTQCMQPQNMLALREKFGTNCPTADDLLRKSEECRKNGGRTIREMDPMGCEYLRCEFGNMFEDKYALEKKFMSQGACPPMEEIDKVVSKCKSMGDRVVMQEMGGCKIPVCKGDDEFQSTQFCKMATADERVAIEEKCKESGGRMIKSINSDGCPWPECIVAGECRKEGDFPASANEKCQAAGGVLTTKVDDQGCLAYINCIMKGRRGNLEIDYVAEVPDVAKLLQVALKLEKTSILLDQLSAQTEEIAKYYEEAGKPIDAERMQKVSALFESAQTRITEIKDKLRENAKGMTREELIDIKKDMRYLTEITMQDALYVMLGGEATGETAATIDEAVDCKEDDGCFQEAIDLCKVDSTFTPGDAEVEVKVESFDDVEKKCIIHAIGTPVPELTETEMKYAPAEVKELAGKEMEMKCKIPMGLGISVMDGPEQMMQYCEGTMAELMQKFGTNGPGQTGPSQEVVMSRDIDGPMMDGGPMMGGGMAMCMQECLGRDSTVICGPGSTDATCSACEDKCEVKMFGESGMSVEKQQQIMQQESMRDEMSIYQNERGPMEGLQDFNQDMGQKMEDFAGNAGMVVLNLFRGDGQ